MIDVIYANAETVTLTGSIVKTPLATVTIPGSTLGKKGVLRVNLVYSHNLSAGNKTISVEIAGQSVFNDVQSTLSSSQSQTFRVRNRNDEKSQLVSNPSEFQNSTTGVNTTTTIDTSIPQQLVVYGQLANGADNLSLDALCVEYLRAPGQ